MAGMLEQILRNVGELGLMKRPVRGAGIAQAAPVQQVAGGFRGGGANDQMTGAEGGDALSVEKSPGKIAADQRAADAAAAKQAWVDKTAPQMDPDVFDGFLAQYEAGERANDPTISVGAMKAAQSYLTRHQKEKHPVYDRNSLPPDVAAYAKNTGMTDEDISAMMKSRYEKSQSGDSGAYRIPRAGLPPQYQYMTDSDISALMRKQQEDQAQGSSGDVYPRLKGTSLKIMNDDTFKRSGLKTGDTVCIKIP